MHFDILRIAKQAHENNRIYCESIGDFSQPSWEAAPEWQRQSAIKGVLSHLDKHSKSISPDPSETHDAWLEEKRSDGWKYGPVKDADKKEHPCFVLYNQLPVEQKMKDYLFGAIVSAFYQAHIQGE